MKRVSVGDRVLIQRSAPRATWEGSRLLAPGLPAIVLDVIECSHAQWARLEVFGRKGNSIGRAKCPSAWLVVEA